MPRHPPAPRAHPSCRLPTHCQWGRRISWCAVTQAPLCSPRAWPGSVINLGADPMSEAETAVPTCSCPGPAGRQLPALPPPCQRPARELNFPSKPLARAMPGPSHCVMAQRAPVHSLVHSRLECNSRILSDLDFLA